ncbi:MAG TPA: hypothetical protein VMV16_09610 [Solirubrobacteraceae bacterium]|nr:hypothetical protein [Solirubrobacteraceae bacterium]
MKRALGILLVLFGVAVPSVALASASTKAGYIAKADPICGAVDSKILVVDTGLVSEPVTATPAFLVKVVDGLRRTSSFERTGLRQLRAIPKPLGSATLLTKLWNTLADGIQETQEAITAIEATNTRKLEQISVAEIASEARYRKLAHSYGFKVCGATKA